MVCSALWIINDPIPEGVSPRAVAFIILKACAYHVLSRVPTTMPLGRK